MLPTLATGRALFKALQRTGASRYIACTLKTTNSITRGATVISSFPNQSRRFLSTTENHVPDNKVHQLITNSKKRVFVFMKGAPKEPKCQFSGVVVQVLDAYGVDYDSYDVLEDDEVRRDVKTYSNWPTIPQVYVDGSFVGGCDILLQMHSSGELKQLFGS